ncbi:MAG: hypothetical protein ABR564_05090 [Candidatus Dormibacteria bacterium]
MVSGRGPKLGRVGSLYQAGFADARDEQMFLSAVSFFATFAAARTTTLVQRRQLGPIQNISGRGKRIHHYAYGIGLLLASGYGWMFLASREAHQGRVASRCTALVYGAGSALTIDEFNVWLHMKNNYWNRPLRQYIDVAIMATSALSIGGWGRKFWGSLGGEVAQRTPRH